VTGRFSLPQLLYLWLKELVMAIRQHPQAQSSIHVIEQAELIFRQKISSIESTLYGML
jgi:hypothetical protein